MLTVAVVGALAVLGAAALPAAPSAAPTPPLRTLLITGRNNHNWQYTSRLHAETLEATGRFSVDITQTPESALANEADLAKYDLFVLDYNDFGAPHRWGDAAEAGFEHAVAAGKGVVAIHSANNAFVGWEAYEKMLGLVWRDGSGHGPVHEFKVELADTAHPITAGLAPFTTNDELYHKLVNARQAQPTLLMRAMSSKDASGTGNAEPMAFTLTYGKGRVFATPLGHVWTDKPETKTSVTNPAFKALLVRGAEWAATGAVTLPATWTDVRRHNTISDKERAEGWELLFDGVNPPKFRAWKQPAAWPPASKAWEIADGTIHRPAGDFGGGCRDLITADEYADFEFSIDWKITPGGNSGIMYRCSEDFDFPWRTGPEMQILDDARHADGKEPKTRAGTLYAIVPTAVDAARPPGEWNHARVVAKGSKIEHWLNGYKVVDADLTTDAYKQAHDASKWKGMPEMGTKSKGHVALQDHGDEVWFRNIKVRAIPAAGHGG